LLIKINSVTTDNARNNDTFFKEFEKICIENYVEFNHNQNHVRCLAHIMNLAVQKILIHIKAENIEDENLILRDEYNIHYLTKSSGHSIFIN